MSNRVGPEGQHVRTLILNAVSLNAEKKTGLMSVGGWKEIGICAKLVRDAATAIQMKATCALDNSGTPDQFPLQFVDETSAPNADLDDKVWTKTVAASTKWFINIPINAVYLELAFTSTAGTANDKLTVSICLK